MRTFAHRQARPAASAIVHDALRSPSRPPDCNTRAAVESRFAHDFSRVRVHTDESTEASAYTVGAFGHGIGRMAIRHPSEGQALEASSNRQTLADRMFGTFGPAVRDVPIRVDHRETLGAAAMTVNGSVRIAPGRFDPHSTTGLALLGHEVAHAIQQSKDVQEPDHVTSAHRAGLEQEADRAGRAVVDQRPFQVRTPAPSNVALYADPTQTDEQQWEDDWNHAAYSADQRRFAGDGRPEGTPKQRYLALCPLYFQHGIQRPLKYVHDNIREVHFFQFATPVHQDLVVPVQTAERQLRARGFDPTVLYSFWGFNPRTTSHGLWSNHADGRAIDIDPDTNPHFDNAIERRVISAVTGLNMEDPIPGADLGVKDTYAGVEMSDQRFQSRFDESGLNDALTGLADELIDDEIRLDFFRRELSSFAGRRLTADEQQERAAVQERIKSIRKRSVGIRAAIRATRRERDLFTTVTSAQDALQQAEDAERSLEAAWNTATPAEQRRLSRALAAASQNVVRKRRRLAIAEKNKTASRLGGFATTGFLTLSRVLVDEMKAAGFHWGGELWPDHKDLMHFQM